MAYARYAPWSSTRREPKGALFGEHWRDWPREWVQEAVDRRLRVLESPAAEVETALEAAYAALNDQVPDIRKSTYSQLLVQPGDAYSGKVIVKSNFNFAGSPERDLGVALDPRGVSSSYFWSPMDYQVYENNILKFLVKNQ